MYVIKAKMYMMLTWWWQWPMYDWWPILTKGTSFSFAFLSCVPRTLRKREGMKRGETERENRSDREALSTFLHPNKKCGGAFLNNKICVCWPVCVCRSCRVWTTSTLNVKSSTRTSNQRTSWCVWTMPLLGVWLWRQPNGRKLELPLRLDQQVGTKTLTICMF